MARMELRIGLSGAGCLLLSSSLHTFGTLPSLKEPQGVFAPIACGIGAFVLLGLAALDRPWRFTRWLILAAFIAEVLLGAWTWSATLGASWTGRGAPVLIETDSAAYTEFAATLLLKGRNPYQWDYSGTMAAYGLGNLAGTPTLRGANESAYPYPALPIWLTVPFIALGLPGTFCLLGVAHIALLALLFLSAPPRWQPIILFPVGVVTLADFNALTFSGVMDVVWVALVVGMIRGWERPRLRAALFGAAMAFKQGPWLITPFLLTALWLDGAERGAVPKKRLTDVLTFVFWSGAVFGVINGPFIVTSLGDWLNGILEPLRDTLVYFSQGGVSGLTQYGYLYLPKNYYLLATGLVFCVLMCAYWRHFRTLRVALWLLPGIFMWFSYRNLVTYWLYWAFPMIAALARQRPSEAFSPVRAIPDTRRAIRRAAVTAGIGAAALVFLTGIAIALAAPSPLQIRVDAPVVLGEEGNAIALNVTLSNRGTRTIIPRFAIQHFGASANPIYWRIVRGPPQLAGGESAEYAVAAFAEADSFPAFEAAQVIVTDAGGQYDIRGVTTMYGDSSFLWPNAIPNAAFRFWNQNLSGPVFWLRDQLADRSATARIASIAGREAFELSLNSPSEGTSRLSFENTVLFPDHPFAIGVFADRTAEASGASFGLELDDGQHLVWISLGASPPADSGIDAVPVLAQPGQWTDVTIDVRKIYTDRGWTLPPLKPTVFQGIAADFRLLRIRLFVQVDQPVNPVSVAFSPILEPARQYSPEGNMASAFDDLAAYYVRYGDEQIALGNAARGLDAYQRALALNPGSEALRQRVDALRHEAGIDAAR